MFPVRKGAARSAAVKYQATHVLLAVFLASRPLRAARGIKRHAGRPRSPVASGRSTTACLVPGIIPPAVCRGNPSLMPTMHVVRERRHREYPQERRSQFRRNIRAFPAAAVERRRRQREKSEDRDPRIGRQGGGSAIADRKLVVILHPPVFWTVRLGGKLSASSLGFGAAMLHRPSVAAPEEARGKQLLR